MSRRSVPSNHHRILLALAEVVVLLAAVSPLAAAGLLPGVRRRVLQYLHRNRKQDSVSPWLLTVRRGVSQFCWEDLG